MQGCMASIEDGLYCVEPFPAKGAAGRFTSAGRDERKRSDGDPTEIRLQRITFCRNTLESVLLRVIKLHVNLSSRDNVKAGSEPKHSVSLLRAFSPQDAFFKAEYTQYPIPKMPSSLRLETFTIRSLSQKN